VAALEKEAVLAALRDSDGNVSKAARALNVARRTLQLRMRLFGIPEGRTGRPRRKLSYTKRKRNYSIGLGAAALVAGAILGNRYLSKSSKA